MRFLILVLLAIGCDARGCSTSTGTAPASDPVHGDDDGAILMMMMTT